MSSRVVLGIYAALAASCYVHEQPMKKAFLGPLLASLGLVLACSTTSQGTRDDTKGGVTGTVNGASLTSPHAVAFHNPSTALTITLVDVADACPVVKFGGVVAPFATSLELAIRQPLVAGTTYTIQSGGSGATFRKNNAQCDDTLSFSDTTAISGTIVLSTVSPSVTGSFTLKFQNGSLSGGFDAPFCNPDAGAPDAAASGCPN